MIAGINVVTIFLLLLVIELGALASYYWREYQDARTENERLKRLLAQKTYIDPENGVLHIGTDFAARDEDASFVALYKTNFGEGEAR